MDHLLQTIGNTREHRSETHTEHHLGFAGMLAHAMEHIAERHATWNATNGQLANYGPSR